MTGMKVAAFWHLGWQYNCTHWATLICIGWPTVSHYTGGGGQNPMCLFVQSPCSIVLQRKQVTVTHLIENYLNVALFHWADTETRIWVSVSFSLFHFRLMSRSYNHPAWTFCYLPAWPSPAVEPHRKGRLGPHSAPLLPPGWRALNLPQSMLCGLSVWHALECSALTPQSKVVILGLSHMVSPSLSPFLPVHHY